ncbi:hypothetical protein PHISCL_10119 [Aspergillus sclerotialis]|uniref:Kelch repeat protein n=1 Tax=Aspergillus sclerotialis TaxID=2070753 RepID=A0A3A2Z5T4_9EURO|nr:hypothetical protein PHISCL_10119 [Aspergillus sclerotialis]
MGILVFIGGEVPSIREGVNATLTPNSWDYVQVYDIAAAKWYKQSTTGAVTSRTEFCASVQHDASSSSYQIYVLGGADFETHDTITDTKYLAIPSFKWFSAPPLQQARMSLTCATYGRQVFGVGGRLAWANGYDAGCYDMPAFIYDAGDGTTRSIFNASLSPYVLPTSTSRDIKESPYPSSWADPALQSLFVSTTNITNNHTNTLSMGDSSSHSVKKGAIAGGVVGGVAGVCLIIAILWYMFSRRNQQEKGPGYTLPVAANALERNELPARELRAELGSQTYMHAELQGSEHAELQGRERFELDTGRGI